MYGRPIVCLWLMFILPVACQPSDQLSDPAEPLVDQQSSLTSPSFVQVASSTPQVGRTSVSTSFPSPVTAGNLNVVIVGWHDVTTNVLSVTDNRGNSYQRAIGPTKVQSFASQS